MKEENKWIQKKYMHDIISIFKKLALAGRRDGTALLKMVSNTFLF